MCTHTHTYTQTHAAMHACARTHARTHARRRRARRRRVRRRGRRRQGRGQRASQSRGRATVSQRGFPHVAQATVSIRGFPQVLFAVASSGRPAMPRDDGGKPSPPDIAACSMARLCGTCMCVWAGGLTCDRIRGASRRSFGWGRGSATALPQGSDAALPYRPGRSCPARRPGRGLREGEDSAAVARPVIGTSHRT